MIEARQNISNLSAEQVAQYLNDWWRDNGVEVFDLPKPPKTLPISQSKRQNVAKVATVSITKPNDAVETARVIAKDAKDLNQLRFGLENFKDFHLIKTATNLVFCDGIENAEIMVIGEAPGTEEDEIGRPFIGTAGQMLDLMFGSIGLNRCENLYITNLINWRPPGNRAPSKEEIAISMPIIRRHIELKKPKVIILVGAVAASALLDTKDGIGKLRKAEHSIEYLNEGAKISVPCFCIYHPAYLMRRPLEKAAAWRDLLSIKHRIKELLSIKPQN